MGSLGLISTILLLATASAFQNVGRVANSNLTLKWKFTDDGYIEMAIEWLQPTFIGLMLGDTMINNDLWLCSLEPNMTEWGVLDRWSIGFSLPLDDTDPNLRGRDDLENKKIEVTDESVFCSFRRKMNTNDPTDLAITKGDTIHVCSSKSWTVNLVKHHHSKFCFYWPVLDGFDGELTEQISADSSWPLIHGIVMSLSWGVLVDFGVSTARYFKLRGLYVISHAVFFLVVGLATTPMAILMIVRNKRDLFYNFQTLSWNVQTHFILGILLLVAVIAQHIIGLLAKVAQESTDSDKNYFRKRLVHRVVGYSTYILTKLQMILGWWIYDGSFQLLAGLFLGWAVLLALLHVAMEWLYKHNRMFLIRNFQRTDLNAEVASEVKSLIEDAEEMDLIAMINAGRPSSEIRRAFSEVQYVLFKGLICQLNGFKHPGGQLIFQKVLGRDISKYIYGGASPQGLSPGLHQHSEYAIKYLQSKSVGVAVNGAEIGSQDWYQREVHQLSKELFKFVFTNSHFALPTNPKDVELYLGRHWLVRSNSTTRPYTILLSQLQCNIEFRTKLIAAYKAGLHEHAFHIQKQETTNELVLMIKRYPSGRVSRSIHEGVQAIEGLYGGGLELQKGLNVVITGGTGILPFLDLFDLLLKKAINTLYLQDHDDRKYDPYQVGYKGILKDMSFRLYASFMTAEEFSNYSWLVDLHLISKKHNLGLFELVVKVPDSQALSKELNRFNELIGEEYLREHMPAGEVSKVYVCGPPVMASSLHAALEKLGHSFMIV